MSTETYNEIMPFASVTKVAEADFPTRWGQFRILGFEGLVENPAACNDNIPPPAIRTESAVALVMGDIHTAPPIVRVHSQCLTGDVFHSLRCDCGEQLEQALQQIGGEDRGVLLYMAQEGRGIGLLNKLRAYELQEGGLDTVEANLELGFPADAREWGIGNQILADLGLSTIRILTNNPKKISGLEGYGLTVVEQVPIETAPNGENRRYLAAKRTKLGHRLHHQDLRFDAEREG